MDNEEGVRYQVLKVYKRRELACEDLVLYNLDNLNIEGRTIDSMNLKDVLGYPIWLGKRNEKYQVIPDENMRLEASEKRQML